MGKIDVTTISMEYERSFSLSPCVTETIVGIWIDSESATWGKSQLGEVGAGRLGRASLFSIENRGPPEIYLQEVIKV